MGRGGERYFSSSRSKDLTLKDSKSERNRLNRHPKNKMRKDWKRVQSTRSMRVHGTVTGKS